MRRKNELSGLSVGSANLYDERSLAKQLKLQKDLAWDFEKSIDWQRGIDQDRFLVPLDEHALFFPGATPEQRLAISQMMGLVIASSIYEMEEFLIRIKDRSWNRLVRRYPVGPEFRDLGEQFFEEEQKHSEVFRRYVAEFAKTVNVDLETLESILPSVRDTKTEKLLCKNLQTGGLTFWWIVASVEQQFLTLYHALRPHRDRLDPLYFEIHEKHFEEEARHASFPYLVVELLADRSHGWFRLFHKKGDLMVAQVLQTLWTFSSLNRLRRVRALESRHPFFKSLSELLPLFEKQSPARLIWDLVTRTPYISTLVNLEAHRKIQRFSNSLGVPALPFPKTVREKLVGY